MVWHMPDSAIPFRHVKLLQSGRYQAIRIPREFEFPGEDASMRKNGTRLIIEPVAPRSLIALLRTPSPLEDEFIPIKELPVDGVDL